MGSIQPTLLDYLRSKTQVDVDSFNLSVVLENGPYADATSNQAEVYTEIEKSHNAPILRKAVEAAIAFQSKFPGVTYEELAVDFATVELGIRVAAHIEGCIHIMANPRYAYSTRRVIEHGRRYHAICNLVDRSFDTTRVVMKVAATWEGLQACRQLKSEGIKTLATTVFTMEQSILAAEAGTVSISPFIHELKAHFDETYQDGASILDVCVNAQEYCRIHSLPTKIKACANLSVEEILTIAGIGAFTVMAHDLKALAETPCDEAAVSAMTIIPNVTSKVPHTSAESIYTPVYLDDEAKYRADFARQGDGKSQYKLMQALSIFCDFQDKAEHLVKKTKADVAGKV